MDDKAEMRIFLGYAANSKGYRVFNLQAKKLIISRDIQVDEDAYWDWENDQIQRSVKSSQLTDIPAAIEEEESMTESDSPVLKTKSLAEIYERCNFAVNEPSCFEEASLKVEWNDAMKEELAMINKNGT